MVETKLTNPLIIWSQGMDKWRYFQRPFLSFASLYDVVNFFM